MAAHSNILAWRIPWTEEPGRLQSIGSQRVRHDRGHWARIHAGREKTSHLSCCLYFLKFIFNWRTVVLQYRVGFCHTSIWINHRYTYVAPSWPSSPLQPHSTPLGCHKVPVWAPWVIQQIPTGYLFYIWWCMSFYATVSICPTLSFPSCPESVLYVCVSTAALQIGSSVPSF